MSLQACQAEIRAMVFLKVNIDPCIHTSIHPPSLYLSNFYCSQLSPHQKLLSMSTDYKLDLVHHSSWTSNNQIFLTIILKCVFNLFNSEATSRFKICFVEACLAKLTGLGFCFREMQTMTFIPSHLFQLPSMHSCIYASMHLSIIKSLLLLNCLQKSLSVSTEYKLDRLHHSSKNKTFTLQCSY